MIIWLVFFGILILEMKVLISLRDNKGSGIENYDPPM